MLALPGLIRRVAYDISPTAHVVVQRPIRVKAQRFLRDRSEFERTIELAVRDAGVSGGVLILLDCEDKCPATEGPALIARAASVRPDARISVVFAYREFESWFVHAAASLAGQRGLRSDISAPAAPDSVRDAKGWLSQRTDRGAYSPIIHQAALAELMDLQQALSSDSFGKFHREIRALLSLDQ